MVTASTDIKPQQDDLTSRRIRVFEQRYGSLALDLACHAAFPLTLTTDVVYCLRENFAPKCPWFGAADVLLSGLCSPIGYDLYEMEGATRDRLLRRLCQEFGKNRLSDLEDFMVAYLQHRLHIEGSDRPLVLGDRPHWTVLACLRSEEAIRVIEQELRRVMTGSDPRERLRLAALVERTSDLLSESHFRPILLNWATLLAQGKPIDDVAAAAIAAVQAGIVLKTLEFESVTLVSETESNQISEDALRPFEFVTVTLNSQGQELQREQRQAFYFVESLGKGVPPFEMVAIPGGAFWMGSPENELGRHDDESPQHEVSVQPFFISKYLVTQSQWSAIASLRPVNQELNLDPSRFKGNNRPVEQVSWNDAVEFCDRLSHKTGRTYRLPTEAEWEYACRAGTTTPFHLGETITPDLANYDGNVTYGQGSKGINRAETTDVGSFPPNPFGLCDMHGNVWEWCLDHWHDHYEGAPTDGSAWLTDDEKSRRVIRGGSWFDDPQGCRSAYRFGCDPVSRYTYGGFRVVCVMPRTL